MKRYELKRVPINTPSPVFEIYDNKEETYIDLRNQNIKKTVIILLNQYENSIANATDIEFKEIRPRGRPKGSKNKVKTQS